MKLKDKLKEKSKSNRLIEQTFLDETILVKKCSIVELKSLSELGEEEVIGAIASMIFDPETKQQLFTAKEIQEDLSSDEVRDLTTMFFKANGADEKALENIEKNL